MSTKREELIKKHRDINVDYEWYDCVESDFKEDMDERGFVVEQMYFSGFWSQGDGACFEGFMRDWKKFCAKVPEFVRDFPYLSVYLQDEGGDYRVKQSGHYYHENCTDHEYHSGLEWEIEQLDSDDPEQMMRYGIYSKALIEEADVYDWLKEYFKTEMRSLYKQLKQEYEYLTSDEAVWGSIEANDLDKEQEDEDEQTYV